MTNYVYDTIFPIIGTIISNIMYLSPLLVIRLSRRQRYLSKSVNPLPWAMGTVNSFGWLLYGGIILDLYLISANALGNLVGIFACTTAMVLLGASRDSHDWKYAGYIEMVLLIGMIIFLIIAYVIAVGESALGSTLLGIFATSTSILMYGAPLSTIISVFQVRDASTIYAPQVLANGLNSLCWFLYGIVAIDDAFVYIPNFLGIIFSVFMLIVKLIFPSKISAKKKMALEQKQHSQGSVPSNREESQSYRSRNRSSFGRYSRHISLEEPFTPLHRNSESPYYGIPSPTARYIRSMPTGMRRESSSTTFKSSQSRNMSRRWFSFNIEDQQALRRNNSEKVDQAELESKASDEDKEVEATGDETTGDQDVNDVEQGEFVDHVRNGNHFNTAREGDHEYSSAKSCKCIRGREAVVMNELAAPPLVRDYLGQTLDAAAAIVHVNAENIFQIVEESLLATMEPILHEEVIEAAVNLNSLLEEAELSASGSVSRVGSNSGSITRLGTTRRSRTGWYSSGSAQSSLQSRDIAPASTAALESIVEMDSEEPSTSRTIDLSIHEPGLEPDAE